MCFEETRQDELIFECAKVRFNQALEEIAEFSQLLLVIDTSLEYTLQKAVKSLVLEHAASL